MGGESGNWCCHYFDPVVWSLDLGLPEKLEANPDAGYDWTTNKAVYPNSAEVRWDFPARGKKPPVAVTWHYGPDGGTIPLPKYWKDDYWPRFVENGELANNGGGIIVGSKGAFVFGAISVSQPLSASTGQYKPGHLDAAGDGAADPRRVGQGIQAAAQDAAAAVQPLGGLGGIGEGR